jgi:hypothetical protein
MMKHGLRMGAGRAASLGGRGGLNVFAPEAEVVAASNALVSGAGEPDVDGTYTPRGTLNGKTYYNLEGSPDNSAVSSVWWTGGAWNISLSTGSGGYSSGEDVPEPWDVTSWDVDDGQSPAPTVTEA